MIDATLISNEKFKSIDKIQSFRFSLPDVPTISISDIIRLQGVPQEAKINTIRISALSTDFDISLRTAQLVTTPSINEIFKVTAINQRWDAISQDLLYSNSDNPEQGSLYIVVTNNDTVTATGLIELEIILSAM